MSDQLRLEIKPEMMQFGARVLARTSANLPALSVGDGGVVSISGDEQAMIDVITDRHVLDASVLADRPPFFWAAEISSSRLDSYDTKMDVETTLKNFAEDLIAGVAFCDSHNHEELPFGRSFAGLLVEGAIEAETRQVITPARVLAAFYTLPGMKTNRVSTDDLILSIRGGTTKDVSVGFKAGPGFMYRCSLCGLDLFDWDCPHIPGVVYEVPEDGTGQMVERYAFAWVVNARLSEVSGAYDGATPYAMILKATREAQVGRIPDRVLKLVESRARVHLPEKTLTIPVRKETVMTDQEKAAAEKAARDARTAEMTAFLQKACRDAGLTGAIDTFTAEACVDAMRSEIARLKPLADDGTTLRTRLIDDCVTEGKRALGEKFKEESQRAMLGRLPVEDITTLRDSYKAQADEKIPGGRKSTETADDDPEAGTRTPTASALPDSAFESA